MSRRQRRIAIRLAAAALVAPLLTAASDPPPVAPQPAVFAAGAGFAFSGKTKDTDKTRQSASGIACPHTAAAARVCLVVFDEGAEARYLILGGGGLTTDPERIVLLNTGGELDAEAAATDGKHYYVTGSHSAKRKSCASNPDSRHLLRFEVDPLTGRAKRASDGKLAGLKEGDLWGLMARLPELAPHVGERKCVGTEPPEKPVAPGLVGQRGVNIEGLATDGTRLFFGFRGPTEQNGTTAKILTIDAKALFEGGDPSPGERRPISTVEVGKGRAIRDLHAVPGGLLILAGPDDDDANSKAGWTVSFWDTRPGAPTTALASLDLSNIKPRPCDGKDKQKPGDAIKPEALAVLGETAEDYQVLILNDGMCDGGPLLAKIRKDQSATRK